MSTMMTQTPPQGVMAQPELVNLSAKADDEDEEEEQDSSAMDDFELSSYQDATNSSMDLSSSNLDTSLEVGAILFYIIIS